jgi:hypothetical protein
MPATRIVKALTANDQVRRVKALTIGPSAAPLPPSTG